MARIRRLVAVAGAAALAGSLVGGAARAESPEVFSGSAAGKALDLVVLDKQATFGVSAAKADSTGLAQAVGAGQINSAAKSFQVRQEADAATADPDVKARQCAQSANSGVNSTGTGPTLAGIVEIGIVCSAASAAKGNGNPSASAEGSVADAAVNTSTALDQLGADTAKIGTTVSGLLDRVCSTLADVNTPDAPDEEACAATATLKNVVTTVLQTKTLDIELGKSTSSVTTDVAKVTSAATAAGAVVKILPLPNVDGLPSTEPIVTISVGEARTTAVYDRATGKATATFDPALVRVTFNPMVIESLPQALKDLIATANATLDGRAPPIAIPNGFAVDTTSEEFQDLKETAGLECEDDPSAVCILPDTPLESRIVAGNGRVTTAPDGSVTAVADGVRLELLKGLDEETSRHGLAVVEGDAVTLALAHAEAAVGGRPANPLRPAQVTTDNVPPGEELNRSGGPLPPLELPRTGGFPWLPILGTGVLSLAALLRRATVKATR